MHSGLFILNHCNAMQLQAGFNYTLYRSSDEENPKCEVTQTKHIQSSPIQTVNDWENVDIHLWQKYCTEQLVQLNSEAMSTVPTVDLYMTEVIVILFT